MSGKERESNEKKLVGYQQLFFPPHFKLTILIHPERGGSFKVASKVLAVISGNQLFSPKLSQKSVFILIPYDRTSN